MSNMTAKKIISILMIISMVLVFAGCNNEQKEEEQTTTEIRTEEDTAAMAPVTEVTTEATTVPETTTAETTTKPDGSSIKEIIDTLEGKTFYLAGTMKMRSGETIDTKMTCDNENYRLEMNSNQMNMSMVYLDGSPYIVNNSKSSYILFDENAINSLDSVLNSFSSYGISFTSQDMSEMKSMMSDFDQNMDFSQYINQGEYSEFQSNEYLCSAYKTEYGSIYIYTQDGTLKVIDMYDADGLRQMSMTVTAFIPQVLTPITLTGLSQSPSIMHLFGLAQ